MKKEVFPHICEWDLGKTQPYSNHEELVRDLAKKFAKKLSIFGASIEGIEPYLAHLDFAPLSHTSYGVAMREIEYCDTSLRSLASVQSFFACSLFSSSVRKQKKNGCPLLRASPGLFA